MVHGVSEESTERKDCRQSLHCLSRDNRITCIKKLPASVFQMEEKHRLEGHMRSNIAGSAVVICTSLSVLQIVDYNNCYLSSNREVEV